MLDCGIFVSALVGARESPFALPALRVQVIRDSPYHSNPALLRDSTLWYGEAWPGPRTSEYLTTPEFVTMPSGGVYVGWFDPLHDNGTTTPNAYLGVVKVQNPTTIALGYTLDLNGATTTGPDLNTQFNHHPRHIVTGFTGNQHFTIGFEQYPGFQPAFPTGVFGGSPVLTTHNSDVYSSPTPVSFAAGRAVFPNVIRFTSNGDIVFAESHTDCVRRVHLSGVGSGTISRVGCNYNYLEQDPAGQWIWLAVDTAGTCGPVDDIIVAKLQDQSGSGAQYTWRMSLDGTYSGYAFGQGWSMPTYAPMQESLGALGHYPWAIEFSKHDGRLIGSGMAQLQVCMGRIKQPGDPNVDHQTGVNFNEAIIESGSSVFTFGSALGFLPNLRPSFWALRGCTGCGFITSLSGADTLEDFMKTYPTDAALGAYIQAGLGVVCRDRRSSGTICAI
jgi:hypothetical protein